jgi:hypothetical protein
VPGQRADHQQRGEPPGGPPLRTQLQVSICSVYLSSKALGGAGDGLACAAGSVESAPHRGSRPWACMGSLKMPGFLVALQGGTLKVD